MTKAQYEYCYQRVRKHFRNTGLKSMSRKELKTFLGLLGVKNDTPVAVHEFTDKLIQELEETLGLIKTGTAPVSKLEELINLNEDELTATLEET